MLIQTQICGIVLLWVILALCLIQKDIDLKTQKMFRLMLVTACISLTLDATSVLILQQVTGELHLYEQGICKLYLVSLVASNGLGVIYFTAELEGVIDKIKGLKKIAVLVGLGGMVAIVLLPISYFKDDNKIYTYGASVFATYLVCVIHIAASIYILFRYKKYINSQRRIAGLMWMGIWIVAAGIQALHNEFLLVGYASAIGVGILFMKLENPEVYVDRETGLLNQQALRMYLRERFHRDGKYALLVVNLKEQSGREEILKNKHTLELQHMVAEYLDKLEQAVAFKNSRWEYILLLKEEADMEQVLHVLQKRFDKPWMVEQKECYVGARFFAVPDSSLMPEEERMLELIRFFVDEGEKYHQRKVMVMDREWMEQGEETMQIGKLIQNAIEENRVEVFYQPIYSTSKKQYVSAEALVRIINPDGSLVPPGQFIPVAEKNGAILELGEIVFRKTCEFIKENDLKNRGIQYLEVNLSAIQCTQQGLAEQYISIMEEIGVLPEMINLEITESAAVRSKEILLENMEKLLNYGVSFSLDDFGTGYSNLNYIMELPVQIVKFDRAMTLAYFESKRGELVMDAAIRMVKAAEMKIVSEGVELKEQLEALEIKDIDYIQGFYFSRPVCGQEFLKLLTNG
ncbi:MAG: EAL domain-containing protein [Lachnospiraceae bacterium]|nr:EAL domain-containing protein [Lachnospiraceae bacterium]